MSDYNFARVCYTVPLSQVNFIAGESDERYSAPDITYLLNISSAKRNYKPVWKSIDPGQVNFIAGEPLVGKEWSSRLAIQYYKIKKSGHALLIVAPLEEDSVIFEDFVPKGYATNQCH